MAYLLDSNVLITAKRDHYRFATFPGFWDHLRLRAQDGTILSVTAVRDELASKKDDLSDWIKKTCPAEMFQMPDGATGTALAKVSVWTMDAARPYMPAARAHFLAVADSQLVAFALANNHAVVTHETPAPLSQKRVKIPDVCNAMGVRWLSPFTMLEEIGAKFS